MSAFSFDATISRLSHTPSAYQRAIYEFVSNKANGNLIVEACAGSGKTTTIVNALRFLPLGAKPVLIAFNKRIADELGQRIPTNASASTLHSFGLRAFKATGRSARVASYNQCPIDTLLQGMMYPDGQKPRWREYNPIYRVVKDTIAALKNDGYVLPEYADDFNLSLPENRAERLELYRDCAYSVGYTTEVTPTAVELTDRVFAARHEESKLIDFDDMLWLPGALGYGTFDAATHYFVDEVQDMNPVQVMMLQRVAAQCPAAKFIFVGDRNQSLYGFRGACSDAMDRVKAAFNCAELPLSVTYRCPTSHVELAQTIVPHLEARNDAPIGVVEYIKDAEFLDRVRPGDMVLCRTNAPLVSYCFRLIKNGVNAKVLGREIGRTLTTTVKNVNHQPGEDLVANLDLARTKALAPLQHPRYEFKAQSIIDKFDCLYAIIGQMGDPKTLTIQAVCDRIDQIFADDANAPIILCSIHKAKGLEADRVFILRPDILQLPFAKTEEEKYGERCCNYVAVTRSKETLIFVQPPEAA